LAGRRDQQREKSAERTRRHQRRLVAGDVRLRREGVHRLSSRQSPRDQVEADGRDAGLGQAASEIGDCKRREHPEHGLARTEPGDHLLIWPADRHDHVRRHRELVAGNDRGTRVGERVIAQPGAVASRSLDEDFEPGGAQLGDSLGYQRDPALTRRSLFDDGDLHARDLVTRGPGHTSKRRARARAARLRSTVWTVPVGGHATCGRSPLGPAEHGDTVGP